MRTEMDKCASCADRPITAELIIKEFISQADMCLFEESLHELFLSFVEKNELTNGEYKDNAVLTYVVLRDLIKAVDKLQNSRKS